MSGVDPCSGGGDRGSARCWVVFEVRWDIRLVSRKRDEWQWVKRRFYVDRAGRFCGARSEGALMTLDEAESLLAMLNGFSGPQDSPRYRMTRRVSR
jgi:hypothetical protein